MYYSPAYTVAPIKTTQEFMKADSGALRAYLKEVNRHFFHNTQLLNHGPAATLPDGSTMNATERGDLTLHDSLKTTALVYPHLANESLLSIG